MFHIVRYFSLFVFVVLLTGCGGYDLSGDGDKDITPPVITILGNNPQTVEVGVACHDSGATAMDDRDGYVQVVVSGTVDLSTPGTYTITYTATDSSGNSTTAIRTVYVIEINQDHTPPVITLNGPDEVYVEVGEAYFEQNATAVDDVDGNLTESIRIWTEHEVKTNQIGDYEVIYTVTDSAGNSAEERRGIHVLDSTTAFKITIETNQTGDSTDTQFTVPTNSAYEYDYKIFCGNDEYEVNYVEHVTGDYVCNYYDPGKYTIYIKGKFPAIYHHNRAEANETLSVDQWGEIEWKSMDSAFEGCGNLRIKATDVPNLSSVTTMNQMFHEAHSMNDPINDWNVSSVTDMTGLFAGALTFNQPLNDWDVSHVTNMNWIFSNAHDFNQSLNDWNVSNVTSMEYMFKEAFSFNRDITQWDVSNVTNMNQMFYEAFVFNQPIGDWNVSKVTSMEYMFKEAFSFNRDITQWDVSNVTTMHQMFYEAFAFNQPIGEWDVSNVRDMSGMFRNAYFDNNSSFNQELSEWDVSNVRDMSNMFRKAERFDQRLDWGSRTVNVTNMEGMFYGAKTFNACVCIGHWDVSNVTNMRYMFYEAEEFNQDITTWDVGSVTDMSYMFKYAKEFNQDIGQWGADTVNVTDMSYMFYGAIAFDQDIGSWNIGNVQSMDYMFYGAELSTDNYDSLLNGWDSCPTHQNNVNFHAGNSTYTSGSSADSARSDLINTYNWTIIDNQDDDLDED